jgi:hypothetical protein
MCVIYTLLLTRIDKDWKDASGTFVVPPPITPFPLPINAQTGMVVRPIVDVAVACDAGVVVVADRAPPTIRLLPFQPTARAPVFIVFTSAALAPLISENSVAELATSVQIRPSTDVAIHARDPLPTATHLCPGATVFVVEYAFHEIPSADHAMILPVEHEDDAGPVAMNRLPFHAIEFAP